MAFKINDIQYDESNLTLLDSVSYPEFKEFLFFTETLYKSDDVYILETHYQKSPLFFEEEAVDGDIEPTLEYRIMPDEEAEQWLEDAVWHV